MPVLLAPSDAQRQSLLRSSTTLIRKERQTLRQVKDTGQRVAGYAAVPPPSDLCASVCTARPPHQVDRHACTAQFQRELGSRRAHWVRLSSSLGVLGDGKADGRSEMPTAFVRRPGLKGNGGRKTVLATLTGPTSALAMSVTDGLQAAE
ncbi:hypothetical protein ACEPAH_8684 [Sanghuangporus vaninii]